MKAGYLAVAAAMAVGVIAGGHHQHGHMDFHHKRAMVTATASAASNASCECGQYTVWVTTYGSPTRELALLSCSEA